MTTIKSLWASVQGNPVFMRRVNGWLTLFWIAMIPVSLVTGWIHSVAFIAANLTGGETGIMLFDAANIKVFNNEVSGIEYSHLLSDTILQGNSGVLEKQIINFPLLRHANPDGLVFDVKVGAPPPFTQAWLTSKQ